MRHTFAALVIGSALATPVHADSVTLAGTSIPIRDCKIASVERGRVMYTDARGQRFQRGLDEVRSLSFAGLDGLDRAEQEIAARRYPEATRWLLRAMLETKNDVQRLWVHARLARVHDLQGQFVAAAGHAARVFVLDDDAAWVVLEPVSEPDAPSDATVREVYDALAEADRRVRTTQLAAAVDRLVSQVQPLRAALPPGGASGPPTISGLTREEILADIPNVPVPDSAHEAQEEAQDPEPAQPPPPPVSGDDPAAIDALLDVRRFAEALAICERLEADPDDRSLSRFLHQYGRALNGVDRPHDAAVMLMRCAILYPRSSFAVDCLIEAALIHRDSIGDLAAARRLLEHAAVVAETQGRPEAAERARALRDALGAPRHDISLRL